MSPGSQLKEIAARKRLIVAQSDLHRRIIGLERERFVERRAAAGGFLGRHRWWLLGGTVVSGWLLTRRTPRFLSWLPAAMTIFRLLRG